MVKTTDYVPNKGDIVWLDFNPQLGHEQIGRRPALVLSFKAYNEKIGLALFCPVTSKEKGYPFEVQVAGTRIAGCVLCDQVKSLDWSERNIEFIEKISDQNMVEVLEKIKVLFE